MAYGRLLGPHIKDSESPSGRHIRGRDVEQNEALVERHREDFGAAEWKKQPECSVSAGGRYVERDEKPSWRRMSSREGGHDPVNPPPHDPPLRLWSVHRKKKRIESSLISASRASN